MATVDFLNRVHKRLMLNLRILETILTSDKRTCYPLSGHLKCLAITITPMIDRLNPQSPHATHIIPEDSMESWVILTVYHRAKL